MHTATAIPMRLRNWLLRPTAWEVRHARVMTPVRVLIGVWLVALTAILCAYDRWWGLALLPFAALHFYFASRLVRATAR